MGSQIQSSLEAKGTLRKIGCSLAHHEKRRGDSSSEKFLGASCRWGVTLKQQDAQWRVLSFRTGHTHALEQLPVRACLLLGQKTMRAGILEKFMPIGQAMQRAGIEASRIHTALTINAQIRDYANNMDLCRRSPRFQPQTCVIFDSMHNKNCFGLCLFCFSCMTPNGCTKVCCLQYPSHFFSYMHLMLWSESMHSDVL